MQKDKFDNPVERIIQGFSCGHYVEYIEPKPEFNKEYLERLSLTPDNSHSFQNFSAFASNKCGVCQGNDACRENGDKL